MADTKLSALTEATALTDADEIYINDGGTSKRATVATLKDTVGITAAVDNTRVDTGVRFLQMVGNVNMGTSQMSAGFYYLYLGYVPAQTPGSISIDITTGTASGSAYVVIYDIDPTDGLPSTLNTSWGPFSTTSTGIVTLTSQVQSVDSSGWYYVGILTDNTNAGPVTLRSFDRVYAHTLFGGTGTSEGGGIQIDDNDVTPSADISALNTWWTASTNTGPVKIEVA